MSRRCDRARRLRSGALALLLGAVVGGCSAYRIEDVPSANQNSRINHLVVHFTSENHSESLRLLTQTTSAPVSAHYLIPDPRDPAWGDDDIHVLRLVPEHRRAWHAGRSSWAGENTLNNRSIGIEIVNESRCATPAGMNEVAAPEDRDCVFLPFDPAQIDLLIALMRDILARHPDIDPVDVVAHADITPARRVDPGPLFPWARLHAEGIGAWPDPERSERHRARLRGVDAARLGDLRWQQRALAAYGYGVADTGVDDAQTRFAVHAFQLHFRPEAVTGSMDLESIARLRALIETYRPERCGDADDFCGSEASDVATSVLEQPASHS